MYLKWLFISSLPNLTKQTCMLKALFKTYLEPTNLNLLNKIFIKNYSSHNSCRKNNSFLWDYQTIYIWQEFYWRILFSANFILEINILQFKLNLVENFFPLHFWVFFVNQQISLIRNNQSDIYTFFSLWLKFEA